MSVDDPPSKSKRQARIAFARRLRRDATDAERKLWLALRQAPFAESGFRRQVPIGPYIADFASFAARLVIEVDGSQHAGQESDLFRDEWFAKEGWRVLRLWNNDVLANHAAALEAIAAALRLSDE